MLKKFRYLGDGLFLLASALYALNRWFILARVHSRFMHGYFNDVLLMPCALPPLLLAQRRLQLRTHDEMPTPGELATYLLVWSILFEVVGPHLFRRATADPWDVAAYAFGAIVAGLWWHRHAFFHRRLQSAP